MLGKILRANLIVIDGKSYRKRQSPHRELLQKFAAEGGPVAPLSAKQDGVG